MRKSERMTSAQRRKLTSAVRSAEKGSFGYLSGKLEFIVVVGRAAEMNRSISRTNRVAMARKGL